MIPVTVIAPITADIQNARLCAQLLSGTQTCNQIILNPQQTAYTPASVDMTTSPAPTVTASSQVTGTIDTGGGGAATSSSSSSSTTTTTTNTPDTTTTPPTSTNNNNNTTNTTTGGPTSSLPAPGGRDTTSPTLTVPNDITLQTNGPTALLEYAATAEDNVDGAAILDEDNQLIQSDNVGGDIFISCSPSSQYFLPVGNRTVECLAADAANNTADASFIVAVTSTATTPPGGGTTLTASANPAIYNNVLCPSPLVFSGTITDDVGNRDVTYRFIFSTGARTPEQTIHFDQPGSQRVSYTSPGIAPPSLQGWVAIEVLQPAQLSGVTQWKQSNQAEMEIICSPSTGSASLGGITASLSANPPIHEGPCPVTIDFRGTINDNVGNRDVTYRINIFSETFFGPDPVIGNKQVIHFDQPGSQSVLRRLGGGDPDIHPSFQGWAVLEILEPIQLASNRAYFEVSCTAFPTLQAENTAALVGNETTTLGNATTPGGADTTPPTVTVPNNMEVETDNPSGTSVTYDNVRAVDNVDGEAVLESDTIRQDNNVGGSITIACDPPSGSTFPVGVTTTVQCNAYDAAGNTGTASFTITVTGTTPPPQTLQAEEEAAGEEEGGEEQPATDGEEQEEGEDGDTAATPPAADGEQPPAATEDEGAAVTAPPANGEGGGE
jgi:hypothetical protein